MVVRDRRKNRFTPFVVGGFALALTACPSDPSPKNPDAAVIDAGEIDAPIDADIDAAIPDAGADAGPHDIGPLGPGLSTLVGSGASGFVNGPREFSLFANPVNVVVGPDGNIYVADFDNGLVRVVTPEGDTSTLVNQQGFSRPFGMAFAADGTFYVQTDRNSVGDSLGALWQVDTETGEATIEADNTGRVRGIAVLDDGRLALATTEAHTLRIYDPETKAFTPLAGTAGNAGFADGTGAEALFNRPVDVVVDEGGDLLVADSFNHRIRKVTLAGVVTTVAGTGEDLSSDGDAQSSGVATPSGLAFDADGNLYIGEYSSGRLRRLSAGVLSTVAGGVPGFADSESPLSGQLHSNEGLDFAAPYLYISDGTGGEPGPFHRVRRLDLSPTD